MEDLNSYILDYLDADEKKALSLYNRSLGYSSFLDTLLQNFKNLEIKDDLNIPVQNWNQMLKHPVKNIELLLEEPGLPYRRTLLKVIRLYINYIFKQTGYDRTNSLLHKHLRSLLEAALIEGIDVDKTQREIKSSLDQLKQMESVNELYDWPYGERTFEVMSDFLYEKGFIIKKHELLVAFRQENPKTEEKVSWNTDITDLVYFSYRMWYNKNPQDYYHIAKRRFKKRDGEEFKAESLRKTFYNIKEECLNNDVIKKRIKLQHFFNEIAL